MSSTDCTKELNRIIDVALGDAPADLVLKGGKVLNVFTGEIISADVAIAGRTIAGVGTSYQGLTSLDVSDKWLSPGLIEGHIHIESSMLVPSAFAAAVAPHGTTAAIADPHEIANVMGIDGVRFMMDDSREAVSDIFFLAPSCVPATHLETSGARLEADDLKVFLEEDRILGLAEVMNFPGVINKLNDVLSKLCLFKGRVIDGHAPMLKGRRLHGYLAAGIGSDHECVFEEEALEKLRAGAWVMIREGTSAKNLEGLIPIVNEMTSGRICLVSDDLHAEDIMQRGHLDYCIRKAVSLGLDPVLAVRMASLNPAQYFGLARRGAVAPGFLADILVISDLNEFKVETVIKNGKVIAEMGVLKAQVPRGAAERIASFNCGEISKDKLKVRHQGGKARVIEVLPDQIITKGILVDIPCRDGFASPDVDNDILKLCVLERHRGSGNMCIGFARGFGFKTGAIASSIAHDSHNLIAVGVSDEEIALAMDAVREMNGGVAVVSGNEVMAKVPLPVAGLMSNEPLQVLAPLISAARKSCRSLGGQLKDPVMALSFLALPVVPELRLTDRGLVDINEFRVVPLFCGGNSGP